MPRAATVEVKPRPAGEQAGYFTPELFRFLTDLKAHNDREWFQANKERYEQFVRDPFLHLIGDLAPAMKKMNPPIVADPDPVRGSLTRIYRDIRFSKDKSPYKTFVAAHFRHARAKDDAAPAYYLHLDSEHSMVGGGIWHPEPPALKKIRDHIVEQPKRWQRAITGFQVGSTCSMAGESLKRPPAGYDPNHPFIEDLRRRDFAVSATLSEREVCSRDFKDVLLERFRSMAPFLQFLAEAVGLS